MSIDWSQVARSWWDEQPHPHGHGLKISEYATAVKLATLARFGGHASGHEAAMFWPQFKASGMSPDEFEHTLDRLAPLSFTYHGRPPTMREIVQFKDKTPQEARRYFGDLPHKIYPHVSAADMVKAVQAAKPHALEHLGREPALNEAAYLHHSGEHPADYYGRIAQEDRAEPTLAENVVPLKERGNLGGRGLAAPGGPPTDQRVAPGR